MSGVINKIEVVETNSSMIDTMEYNGSAKRLTVTFRSGGVYNYANVPQWLYKRLTDADTASVGKCFYAEIRKYPSLYPYTKVN